jgi:hypothetical protein
MLSFNRRWRGVLYLVVVDEGPSAARDFQFPCSIPGAGDGYEDDWTFFPASVWVGSCED